MRERKGTEKEETTEREARQSSGIQQGIHSGEASKQEKQEDNDSNSISMVTLSFTVFCYNHGCTVYCARMIEGGA